MILPKTSDSHAPSNSGTCAKVLRVNHDGRPVIGLVATYAGPVDEGERVLAPVPALGSPVLDTICEHLATISSALSTVPIFSFGGAMSRVPDEATAFPHRDASHDINIVASWLPEQAGDADRHRAWVRR